MFLNSYEMHQCSKTGNQILYLTLRYQVAWPGIAPETWYILIRTLNVGVKRFILWATGALHNSKKNRNNYVCDFYFVDFLYWLIFLFLTPQDCTQTQIDVISTQTRLGFMIFKILPPVSVFILETLLIARLY